MQNKINLGIIGKNFGYHVIYKSFLKNKKYKIKGFSFKENCPDVRNTKIADTVDELLRLGFHVDIHDPWVDKNEVYKEYGYTLIEEIADGYDALLLAVSHDQYTKLSPETIKSYLKDNSIIYDLKSILKKEDSDLRL